jgi:hypothetical protein
MQTQRSLFAEKHFEVVPEVFARTRDTPPGHTLGQCALGRRRSQSTARLEAATQGRTRETPDAPRARLGRYWNRCHGDIL